MNPAYAFRSVNKVEIEGTSVVFESGKKAQRSQKWKNNKKCPEAALFVLRGLSPFAAIPGLLYDCKLATSPLQIAHHGVLGVLTAAATQDRPTG